MGLAVEVGAGWLADDGWRPDVSDLAEVTKALAAEGVEWTAPVGPPPSDEASRSRVSGLPYNCLHKLRRIYALHTEGLPITPAPGPGDVSDTEDLVDDLTYMFDSHLLCHSDCEGFYIPVDFDQPMPPGALETGLVGSSQRLLAELIEIAPAVGIRLEPEGRLTDEEVARLNDDADHPFEIERLVWIMLYEAARMSIESGHPITFC